MAIRCCLVGPFGPPAASSRTTANAARANVPTYQLDYKYVGFGKSARAMWLASDFGPSGVIGDPCDATADLGRQVFEAMVTRLGDTLEEIKRFEFVQ